MRQEFEYQQQLAGRFELVSHIDWPAYVGAKLRYRSAQLLVAEQSGYLLGYVEARIIQPGQRSLRARLSDSCLGACRLG